MLQKIPLSLFLIIILCSTLGGVFGGVLLSPWFSWTGNALSDIGVYESGIWAALVFNSGLIIGGITTIVLTISLYDVYGEKLTTAIGIRILTLAGGALVSIGVFTENSPPYHFIASVLFFVLVPISMWFFSIGFIRESQTKVLGILSLILPFVSVFAWGIPYYDGVAIPEIISSFASWLWVVLLVRTTLDKIRAYSL